MLTYMSWNRHKTDQIMKDALSDFPMCQNEIFYNSAEKEKELERRFRQLGTVGITTLNINHVSSLDELKLKDIVILCVPLKNHNLKDYYYHFLSDNNSLLNYPVN